MRTQSSLAALAFGSGVCGIAYELLYSRVLTTELGDGFHVNATLLTVFLLSIGIGALVSHRFSRLLWAIEIAIGACALAVAFFGPQIVGSVAGLMPASGATGQLSRMLTVALVLAIPATLIGFSVPLFSAYQQADAAASRNHGGFKTTYVFYNLGAALCVLLVEFGLLRVIGIRSTLIVLGLLNFAIGLGLLLSVGPKVRVDEADGSIPAPAMRVLFAISVASGVYQLLNLKFIEIFFGPFHENFSLLLCMVLASLATGTWLAYRVRIGFDVFASWGPAVLAVGFLLLGPAVWFWALVSGMYPFEGLARLPLKCAFLAILLLPSLSFFGATIPALLKDVPAGRRTVGMALGVSSFGNAVGYLLATLFLFDRFTYDELSILVPLALLAAILLNGEIVRRFALRRTPAMVAILAVVATTVVWDGRLLILSYDDFQSTEALVKQLGKMRGFEIHRKQSNQVTLAEESDSESVIINGYRSLSTGKRTQINELIVGMAPAFYVPKRESALVLGLGTGITASATASLFKNVTSVEINPVMVDLLPRFGRWNHDVHDWPNHQTVLDDGLTYLKHSTAGYDAIVSTVTSPLYFASSKLYTSDFFSLVKNRLRNHGVYAMWFDARVREEGTRVVFETLRKSFPSCHLGFLRLHYALVICGKNPLPRPHAIDVAEWRPTLRQDFDWIEELDWAGSKRDANQFILSLLLTDHVALSRDWGVPSNTFDRPQLEFLMANFRSLGISASWTPYKMADVKFGVDSVTGAPLGAEAFAFRCHATEWMAGQPNRQCLTQLQAAHGKIPSVYRQSRERVLKNFGADDRQFLNLAVDLFKLGNETDGLEIVNDLLSKYPNDEHLQRLSADMTKRHDAHSREAM